MVNFIPEMKKMLFLEFISVFLFGALGYGTLETMWRGYTHWTMLITGGLCFYIIYLISTRMKDAAWKKCIMCACAVTTVEFVVGCIVNLKLGWNVWDYSDMKLDLMGQICPLFTFFWLFLSIPCVFICKILKRYVFISRKKA